MERAWDNWERLVAAVLDKEELRRLAYCPSFSSTSSSADLSSRFSFDFSIHDSDVPYSGVSIERETTPASQPSNVFQPAQITPKIFTFRELAVATKKFDRKCLIYEDDFSKVYKGQLKGSKHAVAIKEINRGQNRKFLVEMLMLNLIHHPNLVSLIGYCADGDHKLLVHEYYPLGSLYYHLHEPMSREKPLDWNTRMKIAAGVSRGLEYLHHKANPPVVHRDLTPSNILLDEGHNPKIANFGLSKLGPVGDRTHVSTRVMGTIGYLAPEYAMTGRLTLKADIYSFGVILLELISGRKAVEVLENGEAQNIVEWARPLFTDRRKFVQMVDPTLKGQYAMRTLYQSLAVAAMCVQEQAENRPLMADIVIAMTYLASQKYDGSTV